MDHIENISEKKEGNTNKEILSVTSVTISQNLSTSKDVENKTNTEIKEEASKEGLKSQIDTGVNQMDVDMSVLEDSIATDHGTDNPDSTQSSNDTSVEFSSIEINKKHGLVKPDVMIEIPTQELIYFTDDSECQSHNLTAEKEDIDDQALDMIETEKSVIIDNVSQISESCKNIENETITIVKSVEHIDAISTEENINVTNTKDNTKSFPEDLNKKPIETHTKIADTLVLEKSTDLDANKSTISEPNENIKSESELVENYNKIPTEIENLTPEPKQAEAENKQTIGIEIQCSASEVSDDETCHFKDSKPELVKDGDCIITETPKIVEMIQIDNKPIENLETETSTSRHKELSKSEFKEVEDVNMTDIPKNENSSSQPNLAEIENKLSKEIEVSTTKHEVLSKTESKQVEDVNMTEIPKSENSSLQPNLPQNEIKLSEEIEASFSKHGVLSKSESKHVEDVNMIEIPESENSSSQLNLEECEYKPSEGIEEAGNIESQPSTSRFSDDTSSDARDEVPEMTDSLGLLAESSRVVEDDEDPDQEGDEDEDQEEDEDDQDDESNQTTAEHSEDSNAQHSETDPKENSEMETDGQEAQDGQQFAKITSPSPKETEITLGIEISNVISALHEEKSGGGDEEQRSSETLAEEQKQNAEADVTNEIAEENLTRDDVDQPRESKDEQSMDIETVKLSDISDNETEIVTKTDKESLLRNLLTMSVEEKEKSEDAPAKEQETATQSPKKKKLEIAKQRHVVNIVDLEESSSEDDIQVQETEKPPSPEQEAVGSTSLKIDEVTSVNIPNEIEIICTTVGGNPSEIVTREGEVVISGVPKPPPHKPARLNTGEVTIKTASVASESTLVIPETKMDDHAKPKPKFSLEIFSLDSDEEDDSVKAVDESRSSSPKNASPVEMRKERKQKKCINGSCKSGNDVPCYLADSTTVAFYDASRKKRPMVCRMCAEVVADRVKALIDGVKNFTPLVDLHLDKVCQELVEISDSDSDDEGDAGEQVKEIIGAKGAKFLEEELAATLNKTWKKYKMDERLKETEDALMEELQRYEEEGKEIEKLLDECQVATDKLRNSLYATFEGEKKEISPIVIYDAHDFIYSCLESEEQLVDPRTSGETRQLKRKMPIPTETASKRQAIPLGYAPLETEKKKQEIQGSQPASDLDDNSSKMDDDNVDISVVKLSAESAPAGLPPPGEIKLPPLRVGMTVYAMRNTFGAWMRAKIIEMQPKVSNQQFTMCRVKFEHRVVKNTKLLPARCLAYSEPADVRMTIGTRVIALFKDSSNNSIRQSYYSGIVAEIPNPVNDYRYLVFFDDGYAQYVQHPHTMLVCEYSALVWEEVHPFSRQFVREYLLAYPERPMVRLHAGQKIKTEWNGKWLVSNVVQVDASLVQVHFEQGGRTEWIYRGSTRLAPLYLELQAAERHRARPMPRSTGNKRLNMPYVEYTRPNEETSPPQTSDTHTQQQQNEELRRQRAVAKKSTASVQPPPPPQATSLDQVTSRVVYYTPKSAVKPYKMVPHTCSPKCKRNDVLALKDLRTYNPLAKPLLSGWERQIVRFRGHKEVMYRAPCGRRLRNMAELHRYLSAVHSDMAVDLFDFGPNMHCLAEFVLNRCIVSKKDLSHGKENVPVPCVNYYDDSLPEFCSYNTERTPTAGVPLNLDPEFLCGCDCTDDCQDKSKCACWQMTLEGARTIGLEGDDIGYVYRRLPEPLPSGIYECNSRCKCKQTCLNRVAQHPLQLKLQVFKTLTRGWGIRALNDVPKGSFLCVYAGNLLTDATANLDGLNEGDEYLAELDYIEVVEQMKEGYEDDIPEADKKLDKKESAKKDEEAESSSSDEDETGSKHDKEDYDFKPSISDTLDEPTTFNKMLRRRHKNNKKKDIDKESTEDDTITISDDEEVREPSRFAAQAGMGANEFISKYRSVRSHFGKDEACYIMDAKVQGNIGRYLNHSCSPNVFVQNVFVDTHDPRFPWVAFFALSHIRAGTELTWNYNYDIGSVPGKVLYCYCGSANCRGRLL